MHLELLPAMSAYDMDVSDAIYGRENTGRYVCEPRLIKMIEREYLLLEDRLDRKTQKSISFHMQTQLQQQNMTISNLVMGGWEFDSN